MIIKKCQIEYGIILFILFYPEGFRNSKVLYNAINILQIFAWIYCMLKYTQRFFRASRAIKRVSRLIILYSFYGLISTYIVSGGTYIAFRNVLLATSLALVASDGLTKHKADFYKTLKFLFLSYIAAEYITNLLKMKVTFLSGLNRVYQMIPCLGMLLLLIGQAKGNKGFRNSIHQYIGIVFALALFSGIYMGNGIEAGLLICAIAFIVPFVYRKSKLAKLNVWWLIGIIAGIFVVFVLKNLQSRFRLLKFLIEDVLHKDMNISGRADLWMRALGIAQTNSILGSGLNWQGIDIWYSLFQPHNQYLYEMIVGGVIGFILFMNIILFVAALLSRNREKPHQICKFALFSFLLKFIFTNMAFAQNFPFWIMLLIIAGECRITSVSNIRFKWTNRYCSPN